MTIIYLTEYNTRCYVVSFRNNGCIKLQKFEDMSDDENKIFCVKLWEIILGKSLLCNMTEFPRAEDKAVFDGNTILLQIGIENNKYRYVYIGGDMVCSFLTDDRIYKYISNMGNNLTPYSIAIGFEDIYYLSPLFKFAKKEKDIDEDDIDKLFNYQNISNYRRLRVYKIHSNYD